MYLSQQEESTRSSLGARPVDFWSLGFEFSLGFFRRPSSAHWVQVAAGVSGQRVNLCESTTTTTTQFLSTVRFERTSLIFRTRCVARIYHRTDRTLSGNSVENVRVISWLRYVELLCFRMEDILTIIVASAISALVTSLVSLYAASQLFQVCATL